MVTETFQQTEKKNRPVERTQPVNGISMLNAKVGVREVVLSVGTSRVSSS